MNKGAFCSNGKAPPKPYVILSKQRVFKGSLEGRKKREKKTHNSLPQLGHKARAVVLTRVGGSQFCV
jgi:hypothetical protein